MPSGLSFPIVKDFEGRVGERCRAAGNVSLESANNYPPTTLNPPLQIHSESTIPAM